MNNAILPKVELKCHKHYVNSFFFKYQGNEISKIQPTLIVLFSIVNNIHQIVLKSLTKKNRTYIRTQCKELVTEWRQVLFNWLIFFSFGKMISRGNIKHHWHLLGINNHDRELVRGIIQFIISVGF